jgi:pimeloyl-ACP methyl ester carboxylesterase
VLFLAQNGFRVVAHDRRGHGRSSQASSGNDMDGYAADLAAVTRSIVATSWSNMIFLLNGVGISTCRPLPGPTRRSPRDQQRLYSHGLHGRME